MTSRLISRSGTLTPDIKIKLNDLAPISIEYVINYDNYFLNIFNDGSFVIEQQIILSKTPILFEGSLELYKELVELKIDEYESSLTDNILIHGILSKKNCLH